MKKAKKDLRTRHLVLNNAFPTIGLLTEGLSGQYQAGVWPGIVDAARRHQVNLVCFCGGSLGISTENPWDYQGNVLFEIAEKYPLDGLIIAGSIGCYVPQDRLDEFLSRYSRLKIVTIAPASERFPAVFVDNRNGMRALVTHLIRHHAYRKIAFIKGPENNLEAEERFAVFREILAKHGIPLDTRRILQGDFTRNCGDAAVKRLISSSVEFDAVVAASDETALGALAALRDSGKNVPEEVALVGFDNIGESAFVTPPLTTVHQPVHDLGRTAVERLLQLLDNKKIPKNTIVDAQLVVRQSCGCFSNTLSGGFYKVRLSSAPLRPKLSEPEALDRCAGAAGHAFAPAAREIISCFCRDVNTGEDDGFLKAVDRIGRSFVPEDRGLRLLTAVLYQLWAYAFSHLERSAFAFADDLVHRALLACGNLGLREQGIRRIRTVRKNAFLHEIGDALKNTLDVDKLIDAIHDFFPKIGVHSLYLSLYERSRKSFSEKSRLRYALVEDRRKPLGKSGVVFETHYLLPQGIVPADSVHILVAQPLYFQKEQFGVALFEAELEEPGHYHILREFISGALHSAALMKKVRRQAEVLARANSELKMLREKECAYLQAVKRELDLGREIQMGFLPRTLPQIGGWEISATFKPAREVSGDFYDVFMLGDDLVALVISDVSGKDVSAALFMSLIRTLIRAFAERAGSNGDDPLGAIKVVNDYILQHHIPSKGRSSMYATIVFGLLTLSSGELRYVNAGHIAPLVIHGNTIEQTLPPTGVAVGLIEQSQFAQKKISLKPGDLLFFYTDGVTEAKNTAGDFFTAPRLMDLLQKQSATAREKIDLIQTALNEHYRDAAPYDDITMLAVKRE